MMKTSVEEIPFGTRPPASQEGESTHEGKQETVKMLQLMKFVRKQAKFCGRSILGGCLNWLNVCMENWWNRAPVF